MLPLHIPLNHTIVHSGRGTNLVLFPLSVGGLKALCHAISADCLLIEAACAHAVNEHWAWRMADKFACTFKSARWGSLCVRLSGHRVGSLSYTYQYSYSLAVHNRRLQASQLDCREPLLRCTCLISAYFCGLYRDIGRAHTSCAHFNWILNWTNELIKKQLGLIYGHNAFNDLVVLW